MTDFWVSLTPHQTIQHIKEIVENSITGELIDEHVVCVQGAMCITAVFEKHYYRAGNRVTLTTVVDNAGASGKTRVHCVGSGGGEGLFRFDWGASDSFEDSIRDALEDVIVG